MTSEPIVAVGFLTQRDVDALGQNFARLFTVEDEDVFADLLRQLDDVEAVRTDEGVTLSSRPDEH